MSEATDSVLLGAGDSSEHRLTETVVVSDMHLADEQLPDPKRPYWKAYKRREHFIDGDFRALLEYLDAQAQRPIELVLNGDIFDFDDIRQLPKKPLRPLGLLARLRGLGSEEWMSEFKMEQIIAAHHEWFAALRWFVGRGHRAVFVIGNHDMELSWPGVQRKVREALGTEEDSGDTRVVFANWFYLSGTDTYISHGHQYDPYCAIRDPINPLINWRGRPVVRIPFGDLAARYLLNGMGYFNPHATDNYIMSGWRYVRFFFKYMLRTQPLLLWTWFWSAMVTLGVTLDGFWRPPLRDPLLVEEKVRQVAERANATPPMVRKLNALSVPSAASNPFRIMSELWLDRGLLFLLILYGAFQSVLAINFIWPIRVWWVLVPLALLFPLFLLYSFRVKPGTFAMPLLDEPRALLIHQITRAANVVFGHTHKPALTKVGPVTYANSGFWSKAFAEPECKTRIGTQTFVWLKPVAPSSPAADEDGPNREPAIWEWPQAASEPVPYFPGPYESRRPSMIPGLNKATEAARAAKSALTKRR